METSPGSSFPLFEGLSHVSQREREGVNRGAFLAGELVSTHFSLLSLVILVKDLPREYGSCCLGPGAGKLAVSHLGIHSGQRGGSQSPLVCWVLQCARINLQDPLEFNGSPSTLTFFVTRFIIMTSSILTMCFYGC